MTTLPPLNNTIHLVTTGGLGELGSQKRHCLDEGSGRGEGGGNARGEREGGRVGRRREEGRVRRKDWTRERKDGEGYGVEVDGKEWVVWRQTNVTALRKESASSASNFGRLDGV